MRRGTVVLGGEAASLAPTFVDSGVGEFTWLAMLAVTLKTELPPAHLAPLSGPVRRFAGDMATIGKGEILRLGR
jgi:formylmethanofuran dehydrogenase subunit C